MTSERRNLLAPFRRDLKQDLASGKGDELLRSQVIQVLATEGATPRSSGELPWRTGFGSAIHLIRHQRNSEALAELARVYVRDALRTWLPAVEAVGVEVLRADDSLTLRICVRRRGASAQTTVEVSL
ncbi:MAG: hypothetical protein RBU30_27280 [Polyangia bacterium]|jgi:phage baseplate assembly protein W|nr:hypothetical protein [Polyangia bacterium]